MGASAAWFDYDRDGRLDLFVANYVEFSYSDPKKCEFAGERTYCAQTEYTGSRSRLFHNDGNGRFSDVSAASGVAASPGRALGVVAVDADGDGWVDLFVARDASPNLLLINQRNGTFRDIGIEREIAYNAEGVARSGMGSDVADFNGDGVPDFVVTNFDHEYHALYLSDVKGGPYRDASASSGLARFSQPYVGWGIRAVDFDNDGSPDLLITNGHLHEKIAMSNAGVSYREPPLLLMGDGHGRFENAGARGGTVFKTGILGRGLATGDFDNDGAIDAVIADLNGKPVLMHNTGAGQRTGWEFSSRTKSNRDAMGARLMLRTPAGTKTQWITGGASFLSSHDRRIVFGLGAMKTAGPLGDHVAEWKFADSSGSCSQPVQHHRRRLRKQRQGSGVLARHGIEMGERTDGTGGGTSQEPLPYRKYRVTLRGLNGVRFRAYMGVPVRGESAAQRCPQS